MKMCQHKLTLAYFVYHQVYFLLKDQRASATIISAFSRTPARAHTHPHTLTYTHTHPHNHTHTHHPLTPIPPSPPPASQPPTSHPLILHLPTPPPHSSLLAGYEHKINGCPPDTACAWHQPRHWSQANRWHRDIPQRGSESRARNDHSRAWLWVSFCFSKELACATQGSDYIRRWGQPEYWNT